MGFLLLVRLLVLLVILILSSHFDHFNRGGGFREVVKDFSFNGYYIPKGWKVLYRIPESHKDQSIYSQPEEFNPDRFNTLKAESNQVDYSLVGFGGGARICLGIAFAQMEMKIFASYLLRYYHWYLLPEQDLSLINIPTIQPKSGLKVNFYKISS